MFQFQSTFVKRRCALPTFGSGKHRDPNTRFAGHHSLRTATATRKTSELIPTSFVSPSTQHSIFFSCHFVSAEGGFRVRRSDETRRVGDGTVAPPGAAEAWRGRDSDKSPRGDSSLRRFSCSRASAPFNPLFRALSCPPKAAFVSDDASCPQGGKIATTRFELARTCAVARTSRSANAD